MITQSMFDDFEEKAVNDALIRAIEGKDISLTMFQQLPPYNELKDFEKELKDADKINFQSIFSEPLGFYCIKLFLSSDYASDKAIFVRDVETYRNMRFESARKKVSRLLYQRFIALRDVTSTIEFTNDGISVFEILKRQQEEEKMKEDKKEEKRQTSSQTLSPDVLPIPQHHPSNSGSSGYRQVPTQISAQGGTYTNTLPAPSVPRKQSPTDSPYEMSKSTSTQPSKFEGDETPDGKHGLDTSQLQMGSLNNPIGVYGPSVDRIRDKIDKKNEAPPGLFDEAFLEVMNDLKLDIFPRFLKSEFYEKYIRTKLIEVKKVKFEDFSIFRPLGKGGFGTVYAVQKKDCGLVYAMKCMNKRLLQKKDAIKNILEERDILTLFHSKFVTNLKYAFQDENNLYLVMDLMLGGDLKYHLRQAQGRFSERRARFYAAEILLGLEQLHAQKIIYRDLKFENVLLDSFGHCRLSDMGLARVTEAKIRGYAGTPGYAAPEMMHGHRYGSSVDIFSFGVLLYRMLLGAKPFEGKDLDEAVYNNRLVFPKDKLSKNAMRLLEALLQKKPEHRLGCGPRGIQEIKEHVFFEKIDWGLLEAGYVDPPFIPRKSKINTETMKNLEKEKDADRKYDKIKLEEKFKDMVAAFEFLSTRALQEEMVRVLEKCDARINYEKFASSSSAFHEKEKKETGKIVEEEEVDAPKGCCLIG